MIAYEICSILNMSQSCAYLTSSLATLQMWMCIGHTGLQVPSTLNMLVSCSNQESHFPVQAMDPSKHLDILNSLGGFSLMILRVDPHPICSTMFESSSPEGGRLGIND